MRRIEMTGKISYNNFSIFGGERMDLEKTMKNLEMRGFKVK